MQDSLDNENDYPGTKRHKKKKRKSVASEDAYSIGEPHKKRRSDAKLNKDSIAELKNKVKPDAKENEVEEQNLMISKIKHKKEKRLDGIKKKKKRPSDGLMTNKDQSHTPHAEYTNKASQEILSVDVAKNNHMPSADISTREKSKFGVHVNKPTEKDNKERITNLASDKTASAHGPSSNKRKSRKNRKRDREKTLSKKAKKVFHTLLTENPYAGNKIIEELVDTAQNDEDSSKATKNNKPKGRETDQVDTNHPCEPVEPDKQDSGKPKKKEPKRKKKTDQTLNSQERAEGGPDTKKLGIAYLRSWKTDKGNWHFQKSRQLWLIRNIYNQKAIDNDNFSRLLEYLEGSKGGVRTRLMENAQAIQDAVDGESEDDAFKVNRAKEILQMLSE